MKLSRVVQKARRIVRDEDVLGGEPRVAGKRLGVLFIKEQILSRLEEKGIVRHKGKYWTLETDDRVAGISAMLASTKALNDELGSEEISEWAEHAEEDVESQNQKTRARD